jgi:hypothetical protein
MRYETNEARRGQPDSGTYRLAQFLGIFSLILGVIELIWGGAIARHIGLGGGLEWLVRVYGAREFINGVLILMSKDPIAWIWLRVIGDALDAATLIYGYMRDPSHLVGVVVSFVLVTPIVILDIMCALKMSRESKTPLAPVRDYSGRSGMGGTA